mmetsp:Transcript_33779/g.50087  ORF Transcript_33779/g.50087 Transcript_33779/m.50087 type:complete len:168 (-) Transcript_33779:3625-4128(-)
MRYEVKDDAKQYIPRSAPRRLRHEIQSAASRGYAFADTKEMKHHVREALSLGLLKRYELKLRRRREQKGQTATILARLWRAAVWDQIERLLGSHADRIIQSPSSSPQNYRTLLARTHNHLSFITSSTRTKSVLGLITKAGGVGAGTINRLALPITCSASLTATQFPT